MDTDYYVKVKDFILFFTGLLFEALPWVVIGAIFAGLVQELPPRRAPALMLALGLGILVLTISPLALHWNILLALGVAAVTGSLLLLAQPLVDQLLRVLAARRTLAIFMSGFLGLVNPMCDCGVIVVMRRLLLKGMPLSCCISYILAGPIINVLVIATTYTAFAKQESTPDPITGGLSYQMGSYPMMFFRIVIGYLTATGTALVVERLYRVHGNKLLSPSVQMPSGLPVIELDEYGPNSKPKSIWQSISNVSETALHDFVDVMVPLIIGALLAAGIQQALDKPTIERFSKDQSALAILLLMGVGFLVTLCSETDAFVIANYSLRPSAKLAFLVFGPMLDLKLFFMYTRVFRPRLMWTIIGCVAVQVFFYCLITHLIWENYAPQIPYLWPSKAVGGK